MSAKRTPPFVPIALAAALLVSCASEPLEIDDSPLLTATEIASPARDRVWNVVRSTLAEYPASHPRSLEYFESIAMALYPDEDLRRFRMQLSLERSPSIDHLGFVFPGVGAIVDAGFFRRYAGENEIAAQLAIAFERSRLPSFRDRLALAVNDVSFDPRSLTGFLTEEDSEAAGAAADVLYRAGYDPRGVFGFLDLLPETWEGKLRLMKESAQRRIFKHPPLVNPIVRTTRFYAFQREVGNK